MVQRKKPLKSISKSHPTHWAYQKAPYDSSYIHTCIREKFGVINDAFKLANVILVNEHIYAGILTIMTSAILVKTPSENEPLYKDYKFLLHRRKIRCINKLP